MSTEMSCHFIHLLQVSKTSLWSDLYIFFFMIKYKYIGRGQGQTAPRGQNFDINTKALSLFLFDASFKEISLKSDFIHFFMI